MKWKRTIGWTAAVLLAVFVMALVCGYFFLRSDTFHRYALRKIESAADQATGAKTQIGSLQLTPSTLTIRLESIVIRGTERAGDPPLLRVDELTVSAKIQSILRRKISLRELLIEHPVVHVRVDSQGNSNIPQAPPDQGASHGSVFDLAIGHFGLSNGEIYYNDKKIPVNASLYDVGVDASFNPLESTYAGIVSYSNGQLVYAQYAPMQHSARLQFSASPLKFTIESGVVRVGSSVIAAKGDVANFSNPIVAGNYDIRVHTQDFASMSLSVQPAGDVHVAGTIHYQNNPKESFLRGLVINGDLDSDGLSALSPSGKLELSKVKAHYDLANANLRAKGIEADALGGRITAEAEMQNIDTTQVSRVRATIHNVSLRALQQSVRGAQLKQVAVTGTLDGTAEAGWTGSITNIRARSDLTVRADAKSSSGSSASVPADGVIHAAYDAPSDTLTVRQSSLRAASLTLTADGEISQHSKLQIHAQADDLHQLMALASSFSASQPAPLAVSGSAGLDATLRGTVRNPQASGQMNAQNLQVQGSTWKAAALSFTATPAQFTVSNGSIVNASQGRAAFEAKVTLHNWTYSPQNPIHANLSVQRLSITDLQHLANLQYPVSGDLSAHISLDGTQLNPSGSGSADIANARAYGEPIQTLALKFQAANGSITSTLNATASAGSANTSLTYIPKTRAYKVKFDAPALVLQKLHRLQGNQAMKGTVSISASGEGTIDDPQLTALIQIPRLEMQQKSIAGLKANVQIANRRANLALDTELSQATLHAHARIDLTGDYQTDVSVDTSAIPVDALLTTFSSTVPEGFQGQTELHATLKGPLKDKTRLEAHVTIPTLTASYQQLQIGASSPIHADYVNSVVTLQPAEIRGTGTSLRVQGSIPLAGTGAPNLTAQGTVDVRIARLFAPDLRSSGTLALDLHASGSPSDPSLQGQIRMQDIYLSTAEVPLGVEKLNGTIDVANDRAEISSMTGEVGSGQFSLAGSVAYRPSLQFTLALQGKSIRLRYPTGLRTVLDGNLALTGNLEGSSLSGRVLLDTLSFTPDFDLASFGDQFSGGTSTPAQPGIADTVKLNVSLQSKDNLSATSSQVSVEGSLNLNIVGTATDPVITGRTELTSGEIFYRGNRYQLQRGVITFADPNQTNPNLNLSASTTVEQYNLTINLRGPLDRLTTTYVSDPPLATADIIHLVAFGKTTSESAASSQSTDSMLASSALGTGVTSGVQKLAGFSSLQIDPLLGGSNQNPSARIALQQRVTKNFLFTFSTDVSQPGEEIVQGDYQINKHWSVNVTRDQLGGITVAGRLHTKF